MLVFDVLDARLYYVCIYMPLYIGVTTLQISTSDTIVRTAIRFPNYSPVIFLYSSSIKLNSESLFFATYCQRDFNWSY